MPPLAHPPHHRVNYAARVSSIGIGGEIVISSAAWSHIRTSDAGQAAVDRADIRVRHRQMTLKGIAGRHVVYSCVPLLLNERLDYIPWDRAWMPRHKAPYVGVDVVDRVPPLSDAVAMIQAPHRDDAAVAAAAAAAVIGADEDGSGTTPPDLDSGIDASSYGSPSHLNDPLAGSVSGAVALVARRGERTPSTATISGDQTPTTGTASGTPAGSVTAKPVPTPHRVRVVSPTQSPSGTATRSAVPPAAGGDGRSGEDAVNGPWWQRESAKAALAAGTARDIGTRGGTSGTALDEATADAEVHAMMRERQARAVRVDFVAAEGAMRDALIAFEDNVRARIYVQAAASRDAAWLVGSRRVRAERDASARLEADARAARRLDDAHRAALRADQDAIAVTSSPHPMGSPAHTNGSQTPAAATRRPARALPTGSVHSDALGSMHAATPSLGAASPSDVRLHPRTAGSAGSLYGRGVSGGGPVADALACDENGHPLPQSVRPAPSGAHAASRTKLLEDANDLLASVGLAGLAWEDIDRDALMAALAIGGLAED